MRLIVAKTSGFCFGVDQAVRRAYTCLEDTSRKMPTYMLGALTHNESVIAGLASTSCGDLPLSSTGIFPLEMPMILLCSNCFKEPCFTGYS